jgi:hypothetical protein
MLVWLVVKGCHGRDPEAGPATGPVAAGRRPALMGAYTQPAEYIPAMTNPSGVVLDDESLRWAAAESVSEAVIAAICLLETRTVDEIVARLTTSRTGAGHQDRRAVPKMLSARGVRRSQSPTPAVTQAAARWHLRPGTATRAPRPSAGHGQACPILHRRPLAGARSIAGASSGPRSPGHCNSREPACTPYL